MRQFRHPLADIVSIGIKLQGLADRIKNPEVGHSIHAGRCTPLPATIIRSQIAINQVLHKPAFTQSPVDQQVLTQEHRSNHPDPVMHPASCQHLPHASIDNWNSGLALLPGS